MLPISEFSDDLGLSDMKRLRTQADKLGCTWNQKQRVFLIANGESPPLALSAAELIELGVELVEIGTDAIVQRRWQ